VAKGLSGLMREAIHKRMFKGCRAGSGEWRGRGKSTSICE